MADLTDVINRLINENVSQPSSAVIFSISGNRVDVQVRGSATLLKNLPVSGNPNALEVGQTISLKWEGGKPIAIATSSSSTVPLSIRIMADNDSIENSSSGIRIRAGGVRLWHLDFRPSLEGHTHLDMLQRAGWTIDDDGSISKDSFFIHPDGRLSMGSDQDVIKLEATHPAYRLWVGSTYPETANFSVTKEGDMKARSGQVAGWDILSDRLSKNGAELKADGELHLGTGDNKVVASGSNIDGWRLWAGAAIPTSAPFRVNQAGEVWLDNAHFSGDAQSDNYQSGVQGWSINNAGKAEFNDVIIRGLMQSVVFAQSTTSVMSSRTIITDGGALIYDVGN